MDQCLSRNYLRLKRSGIRALTWLRTHSHILKILVPMADLEVVLKAEGEWSTVGTEITRLMESSVVARTIFGFCGQLLSSSNYKAKIEQYLEVLGNAPVTDVTIKEFKAKALSAATAFKACHRHSDPLPTCL
jgi:hypothetical protein